MFYIYVNYNYLLECFFDGIDHVFHLSFRFRSLPNVNINGLIPGIRWWCNMNEFLSSKDVKKALYQTHKNSALAIGSIRMIICFVRHIWVRVDKNKKLPLLDRNNPYRHAAWDILLLAMVKIQPFWFVWQTKQDFTRFLT